jgi:hypothetical protein
MKKSLLTAVALAAAVAFSAPVMANAATAPKPAATHVVHKKAVKHHVRKAKACHATKKHHCPTVKHVAKAKHASSKMAAKKK